MPRGKYKRSEETKKKLRENIQKILERRKARKNESQTNIQTSPASEGDRRSPAGSTRAQGWSQSSEGFKSFSSQSDQRESFLSSASVGTPSESPGNNFIHKINLQKQFKELENMIEEQKLKPKSTTTFDKTVYRCGVCGALHETRVKQCEKCHVEFEEQ